MKRQLVDRGLLRDIDEKKLLIEKSIDASLADLVRNALENDALANSDKLEAGHTVSQNSPEGHQKITHIVDAWDFAKSAYHGDINHSLITGIVQRIMPGSNVLASNYRHDNVRITGSEAIIPPRAEKVYDQMNTLIDYVNDSERHPVESAGLVHLHIARIHPFLDGNGRTARLVQNLILDHEGYAPACVSNDERLHYQTQLRRGIRGYQEREGNSSFEEVWLGDGDYSEGERNFFEYIGTLVNKGMASEITQLDRLPSYTITIHGKHEPGQVISLKREIDSLIRARNILGQVRVKGTHGKSDCLVIRADAKQSEFESIVRKHVRDLKLSIH